MKHVPLSARNFSKGCHDGQPWSQGLELSRWQAHTAQRLWKMESLQNRRLDLGKSKLHAYIMFISCQP